MRLFVIAVLAFMYVRGCEIAFASPLDCESIQDPDRRHMCRAITKHDRSECELIKEHDLRAQCRAQCN